MAELRCPMCGESNPDDREICDFCQARLKPLHISESFDDLPSNDYPGLENHLEADAELPDWLRAMRERSESLLPSNETEEETPEWMKDAEAADAEAADAEAADAEDADQEEPPTFQTGEVQDSSIDAFVPHEQKDDEADLTVEEVPEWLKSIQSREEALSETSTGVEAEQSEQDLPGWLSRSETWIASPEEAETDSEHTRPEEMPEWLSGIGETPVKREEPTAFPDWLLKDDVGTKPDDSETEQKEASTREEVQPGEGLSWLKDLEANVPIIPIEPDKPEHATGDQELSPFSSGEESQSDFEPLYGGVLPDWLLEISPEEEPPAEDAAEDAPVHAEGADFSPVELDQEEPDLAPAEIPIWLEAMRPVEAVAGLAPVVEESQDEVASAGPLAGLSGILPAELAIPQVQKPPAYLVKLQVTESQQSQANLLEEMLKTEVEAHPISDRPETYSQHIQRLVIALVLFLAVVWSIVTGTPQVELPAFSVETALTSQLVAGINIGEPALLAFDYEPGSSAEMDTTAASVVDHLMRRGSYLTLVSTSPTGPAQAERLLATINQGSDYHYTSPDQYTNLGFIPGGPVGLLSFAQTPRQVLPLMTNGNPAWQNDPLRGVDALSDFSLALVITENPDNARAWIEQVGPFLENTPLVMVVSAQAEPMVRPFYEANPRQVQALVTGLSGAMMYENLMGESGLARSLWTPFSIGLLVASVLILVGGIFNAVSTLFLQRNGNAGGEKPR